MELALIVNEGGSGHGRRRGGWLSQKKKTRGMKRERNLETFGTSRGRPRQGLSHGNTTSESLTQTHMKLVNNT